MFGVILAIAALYCVISFEVVPELKRIADALENMVEDKKNNEDPYQPPGHT